jgi:hypothetical protein
MSNSKKYILYFLMLIAFAFVAYSMMNQTEKKENFREGRSSGSSGGLSRAFCLMTGGGSSCFGPGYR